MLATVGRSILSIGRVVQREARLCYENDEMLCAGTVRVEGGVEGGGEKRNEVLSHLVSANFHPAHKGTQHTVPTLPHHIVCEHHLVFSYTGTETRRRG